MDSAKVILPPCMIPQVSNLHNQSAEAAKSDDLSILKKSPWGKVPVVDSISFNDVMSEQLANELEQEEKSPLESKELPDNPVIPLDESNTCNDFLLAQMMQLEFDKEHDSLLRHEEKKYNRSSRVSISFGKYLRAPDSISEDEDDNDETLEIKAKRHWHEFDKAGHVLQHVGKSGVSRQGNTTTTKHDIAMCGRRNASRMMEFPPGIETGDGSGFDMKLSNNVYNTLKIHSRAEERRSNKIHDKKEKATTEKALDEKTYLILYKMLNNENAVLSALNGCISTGKEACVYHAISSVFDDVSLPVEYAVKVFKTTLNEFHNREQYIRDDHRFRDRYTNQNPRKIIHLWAEKEMSNLRRIKKAELPCPEVIALKKHVLVMSFIGKDGVPAPKLKEAKLPLVDMTIAYEETLDIMKTLYHKCQLVHGDLNEYNLLWFEDKVWVIDVSQAVEITHPCSLEFLLRDCQNIINFFENQGVINCHKPETLFADICGQPVKT